ncbi:hypothetical protein MNBD_ALPHA09-257 [hydrothermal vent metagenome]|uniref:Uncharacterized protein n=1 Tax=hydrothermal vent metagenome TaxID=652676 RepID=A0A3B0TNB1_9ZZZZ
MAVNIINHITALKAARPELVTFQTHNPDGEVCLAAVATGLVPMSLHGRTHSYTHNVDVEIELPFEPASQVVSLAPRGHELRGLARFGFRRTGWSIVDYSAHANGHGVRVNMSLWVNNAAAWSLGVIYHCTALSGPVGNGTD